MIKPQTPAAASLPPPGREKLDVDELELTNPTTTPTSPQPVLVHLEHLDHVSRLEDDWIIKWELEMRRMTPGMRGRRCRKDWGGRR